jgi:hypothetical protein
MALISGSVVMELLGGLASRIRESYNEHEAADDQRSLHRSNLLLGQLGKIEILEGTSVTLALAILRLLGRVLSDEDERG